jgi:hypothetical protein
MEFLSTESISGCRQQFHLLTPLSIFFPVLGCGQRNSIAIDDKLW